MPAFLETLLCGMSDFVLCCCNSGSVHSFGGMLLFGMQFEMHLVEFIVVLSLSQMFGSEQLRGIIHCCL